MKKFILKIFMVFLFISGGVFSAETKGTIYVGTDAAEFQPFEYIENGEVVGFDIDLMKEIGKVLGRDVVVKNITFDGLLPALQTGKLDVVIAGMTVTEERKKHVNFSEPYYTSKQYIIVHKENKEIKNFKTLLGHKIGVVLGCTGDVIATELGNKIDLKRYTTTSENIIALKAGKIDAVILDSEPAKNFVKKNLELKLIDDNMAEEDYAIAVKKKDTELLKDINKALKVLKENGTYDALMKKYFVQD